LKDNGAGREIQDPFMGTKELIQLLKQKKVSKIHKVVTFQNFGCCVTRKKYPKIESGKQVFLVLPRGIGLAGDASPFYGY
jgi:hypothetical protein